MSYLDTLLEQLYALLESAIRLLPQLLVGGRGAVRQAASTSPSGCGPAPFPRSGGPFGIR